MDTRRCAYCHTLQRIDEQSCRRCGRMLPLTQVERAAQDLEAPSMPLASFHRAGHSFGLHPEDQPYQSSLLAVQRPTPEEAKQRRRMQQEPEHIVFPATKEAPALKKARRDVLERIHTRRRAAQARKEQQPLPPYYAQPRPFFSSRTISVLLTLSCIFFLLAASIIAFVLIGKRVTRAADVSLNISPSVLRTHDTFTLTGSGFAAQDLLSLFSDSHRPFPGEDGKPLQAHADQRGAFTIQGHIPDNWSAGSHVLSVEDNTHYANASVHITVLAPSQAAPVLQLSQSNFQFPSEAPGIVSSQNVVLTNKGGGELSWQASSDSSWLSVTPGHSSFSGQQSVQVTVNRGNLKPQAYVGHIIFSQNGQASSEVSLTVYMEVKPAPAALSISTTSLTYSTSTGIRPNDQFITLHNSGGQPLIWSSNISTGNSSSWLAVTPAHGELEPGTDETVAVNVISQQLPVGSYQGTVNFTGGANATLNVGLTVVAPGQLVASPSELHFTAVAGKSADEQSVTLQNNGGSILNWTVNASTVDGQKWLQVIGHSGSLNPGDSTAVDINANSSGLQPGSYQGTLTFTSANTTREIAISFTVTAPPAPVLNVQTTAMQFATQQGQDPAVQQVTISNTGNAPMQWKASADQTFLTVTPAAGALAPGQSTNVSVSVSVANMAVGTKNAIITFSDGLPEQTTSNQKITVNISISSIDQQVTMTAKISVVH